MHSQTSDMQAVGVSWRLRRPWCTCVHFVTRPFDLGRFTAPWLGCHSRRLALRRAGTLILCILQIHSAVVLLYTILRLAMMGVGPFLTPPPRRRIGKAGYSATCLMGDWRVGRGTPRLSGGPRPVIIVPTERVAERPLWFEH